MSIIAVVGGTGFTGGNIVKEALSRGHTVVSYSRHRPTDDQRVGGVDYRVIDISDPKVRANVAADVDVVVLAVPPRGSMLGHLVDIYAEIAAVASERNIRLGVVGAHRALRFSEHGPRVAEGEWPDELEAIKPEGREMAAVIDMLERLPSQTNWFCLTPGDFPYGPWAVGERRGNYHFEGDIFPKNRGGGFGAEDFASAFVDLIEDPSVRGHLSVRY